MNSWDRFLLVVWRCTIGPILFCLLLICGIASFCLGGPRFFLGCWTMSKYGMMVDWDSEILCSCDEEKLKGTNLISRILWTALFGLWLRLLFMILMFVTHLLFFSDWLAKAMLDLANCARNPACVGWFLTRYWLQFEDKCDWRELDHWEWVRLLAHHPQFADKCNWAKLNGWDWKNLLDSQPQFADRCDWQKLDRWDWVNLLLSQPQFADKCDWAKLNDECWELLLKQQPQFASMRGKRAEMEDGDRGSPIKAQPQFADRCNNKWAEMNGLGWADLLADQPQFADKCDWSKLDGGDWMWLLADQPQFADMCDWSKLVGCDWAWLLASQPQFADKCDKWGEIPEKSERWNTDWRSLLAEQPQLAKYKPEK